MYHIHCIFIYGCQYPILNPLTKAKKTTKSSMMIVSDGMASLGKVILGDGDAVGAPGLELHPLPLLAFCQAHVVSLKPCLDIICAPTLFPLVRPASVALAGKEVKAEVE